ncbi:hypothetical protein AN684_0205915 [Klebsiella pneumoniae subsp. pneumoniae]|nr:hypothetical protein AN684_0205915 [Klebsiella pneumoniae subsp. pneumoniae]
MTADQIIEGILGKEGGYVNNPNDKGGPTRWGITQTTARAYGYKGYHYGWGELVQYAVINAPGSAGLCLSIY